MGYDCKCGFCFCKNHRLPEDHDCNFDFQKLERDKLAKSNPLITANKLEKV